MPELTKKDSVETPSPAWLTMEAKRRLPRALMGGTTAMRAAGDNYLPEWPKEDPKDYERRLELSTLWAAYQETVDDFTDKVFSEPLKVEAPDRVLEVWADVDGQSTPGELFCKEVARESLGEGISQIIVDQPRLDRIPQTQSEEEAAGIRPRWIQARAKHLIEAIPTVVNGTERLSRARWEMFETKEVGEWGSETEKAIKVFRRGLELDGRVLPSTFQLYRRAPTGNRGWVAVTDQVQVSPPRSATGDLLRRFVEPPIVPFYTKRSGFFLGFPVFSNLAEMNASHWRKSSDKDNSLSVASVPAKFFAGFGEKDVKGIQWGPYKAAFHPKPDRRVDDIAHDPKSVELAQRDLDRLEHRMAIAAMEPSISRATGEEKSTIRLIDEARKLNRAQAWALTWAGAIEECLRWTAAWMGLDVEGITVRYEESVFESLARPDFKMLLELRRLGVLSRETLLREAQRYGHLSDVIVIADELDRIAQEQPSFEPIAIEG